MAGRRRAGGLVVDRRHHAEHAVIARREEPAAGGGRRRHEGLARRVACGTRLGVLVDGAADVAGVRREHDAAFLVEDAHLLDALEAADRLHDPVDVVPLVLEHEIPCARRDRARELRGAPNDLTDEVRPLGADREESKQRDRGERDCRRGRRQLESEMPVERDAEQGFLQPEHPGLGRRVNPLFELLGGPGGSFQPSFRGIRTHESRVDTIETRSAPRKAGTKPSTLKSMPRPRPTHAANMSMRAFTTNVNNPSVSSMIGQLTSLRKGLTRAFTTPNTSASARSEPMPPAWIPGTNAAAAQRAAALMRTRRMILMSRTSTLDSSSSAAVPAAPYNRTP